MPESSSNENFLFSSTAGWTLCRKILLEKLPFCPHDYQLEGITAILDGKDLLAISATGSGKSGYIYMLMHIILAILEQPSLCPAIEFPKNPAILVIYPTTAGTVPHDKEKKMKAFGLTAVAVNSTTKSEMDAEGGNIWKHVESETTVILVSPEMLSTSGFGSLLWTWGEEFRPAFRQIGYIRARFSREVRMLAMTATHLVRRSNARPDIKLVFRTFNATQS